jgi:hypothetical protein
MENEQQYGQMNFNLPHDVVPLPSQGLFYANKKKSVKVGYLTAQDENLLMSTNNENVINQLLKSKIYEPDLKIDEMLGGDIEAILLFLRNTAFGAKYVISAYDSKTNQRFDAEVNLSEMNIKKVNTQPGTDGFFETTLPTSNDIVKLKILTYGEENMIDKEMEIYPKSMIAPIITRKLEAQIISINGNTEKENIVKYIQQMPISDSKFIRKFLKEVEPRLDLTKQVRTPSGEMIDITVNFGVEFFRPFFGV